MSWQGVPFKLLEAGNVDQLFLKLSSLPKLTIDTPTDYNQLALTVGATFFGGYYSRFNCLANVPCER